MEGYQKPQEEQLTPEQQIAKKTQETILAGKALSHGGEYAKEYVANKKTGEDELTGRIEIPKHIVEAAKNEMLLEKGDSTLGVDMVGRIMGRATEENFGKEVSIKSETLNKTLTASWAGGMNVYEKYIDERGEEDYNRVDWNHLSLGEKKEIIEKIFGRSYDEAFEAKQVEQERVIKLLDELGVKEGDPIIIKMKDGSEDKSGYFGEIEKKYDRGIIFIPFDKPRFSPPKRANFEEIESIERSDRERLAA